MKMTRPPKPKLVQLFENWLWGHSPENWILKTTYLRKTLFVSMLIKTSREEQSQKIRRSFSISIINSRSEDLCGLAADCIDEMKTELKTDENTV